MPDDFFLAISVNDLFHCLITIACTNFYHTSYN